jgi:hypothetical protein
LLEPQLFNDEFFKQYRGGKPKGIGLDIITDSTVRYGVYQAWKVRITRTADSIKEPTSTKESVYVLTYPRNPDWIFCAKRYNVLSSSTRDRTVIYTDFQNGKEYHMQLSPQWPRPWQIYEIEILNVNSWAEIWQASKHFER